MGYPFELDSYKKQNLVNSLYGPLVAIIVLENGKEGVFDLMGNLIAKPRYSNLHFDYWNIPYTILENGEIGYIYNG